MDKHFVEKSIVLKSMYKSPILGKLKLIMEVFYCEK